MASILKGQSGQPIGFEVQPELNGVPLVKAALNADDSAPIYACRAWVNFDGTRDASGNLSTANTARLITASGNVSSVVRNGLGDFTIIFGSPMNTASYTIIGTGPSTSPTNYHIIAPAVDLPNYKQENSVRIRSYNQLANAAEKEDTNIAIFG